MSKLLTKTLLQRAADLLAPNYLAPVGEKFMCHAVHVATGGSFESDGPKATANPAVKAFEVLLRSHGVSHNGTLRNDVGVDAAEMGFDEMAELRFDFMNLLAESI